MAYLGLVPCEDSSGPRRRQGAITKAGNSAARRMLVEIAHLYRHPARVSAVIASAGSVAQGRHRYRLGRPVAVARSRRLAARRLPHNKIVVAIARELAGFVWAIAREVTPVPLNTTNA